MTNDTKPDMMLWLDVETTALDPTRGQLLEVGMAVTGMDGETPDDVDDRLIRTWVIEHDAIRLCPDTAWAVDVHTRNGPVDETFGDDAVGAYTAAKQINGVLADWAESTPCIRRARTLTSTSNESAAGSSSISTCSITGSST